MFYTYVWLRENGTPYYIGKGHGNRAFVRHHTRHGRVYSAPPKERIVIYPAESEVDAFETEIALIWYYGRKDLGTGILRNMADGGENPPWEASRAWSLQNPDKTRAHGLRTGYLANVGRTLEEKQAQGLKEAMIALSTRTHEEYSAAGRKSGLASAAKKTHVKSLHVRWHVNRDIMKPTCPLCITTLEESNVNA
jgi:hypothetical protein